MPVKDHEFLPKPQIKTTPFWRDERVLQNLVQVIFVLVIIWVGYLLADNVMTVLRRQGMVLGFSFLEQTASFEIINPIIPFSRESTYGRALLVGFLNTISVSLLGIIFSTLMGVGIGAARLSSNFIINRLARFYIEIFRNIPTLIVLVFWYQAVFLKWPNIKKAIILPGNTILSNRGIQIPTLVPTATFSTYIFVLIFAVLAAAGVLAFYLWRRRQTGFSSTMAGGWSLAVFFLIAIAGFFLTPNGWPLMVEAPYLKGFNVTGGVSLTTEFLALLSGLVITHSAFIADVVRAGLQSVPKGQVEAAKALGLKSSSIFSRIVLPQATRVMIPPMASQYLNLFKNSSLAIYIAFPDFFRITGTVINQTGRAVEMIALAMLVYLTLSLMTSFFMNRYNAITGRMER